MELCEGEVVEEVHFFFQGGLEGVRERGVDEEVVYALRSRRMGDINGVFEWAWLSRDFCAMQGWFAEIGLGCLCTGVFVLGEWFDGSLRGRGLEGLGGLPCEGRSVSWGRSGGDHCGRDLQDFALALGILPPVVVLVVVGVGGWRLRV